MTHEPSKSETKQKQKNKKKTNRKKTKQKKAKLNITGVLHSSDKMSLLDFKTSYKRGLAFRLN